MDLRALKQQIPILPVAQELTKLRQAGATWRGGCPCCGADAKKLPFLVDPVGQRGDPHYHCFSCGDKGDVFNLWALKTTGHAKPTGAQWREVVKDCAAAHHVDIIEDGPRDPRLSRAERLRGRVQEAWAVVADHAASGWRDAASATAREDLEGLGWTVDQAKRARLGFLPTGGDGIAAALTVLGFDDETRRAAGLGDSELRLLVAGRVLLRRTAAGAMGLSQPLPNGTWAHCIPDREAVRGADSLAPAFLGDAPRGKHGDVVIAVVPDLDAGLAIAAAVRDAAGADTGTPQKVARAIGIAVAGEDDPTDPSAYAAVTGRAVVLLPTPDHHPKEVVRHGERLIRKGIMVRVGAFPALAPSGGIDGLSALRNIVAAPEFFAWEWQARPGARAEFRGRAGSVVERVTDDLARAVLAHRVGRVSGTEPGPDGLESHRM